VSIKWTPGYATDHGRGSVSHVAYDEVGRDFDAVRDRQPEAQRVWWERVRCYLSDPPPIAMVDVGSGTGIWSKALADCFGSRIHAVEPSDGMRTRASVAHPHPRVEYMNGHAEALPLPDESVGAAWLSTVIHQLPDLPRAARELRRVVEPGGPVLIRSGYPGRQDEIELFHLFPGAMRVAESWPRLGRVITAFEDAGFVFEAIERIREPTFDTYEEVLALLPLMRRSDSALVDLDDEEWAKGIASIERAIAAGERPWRLGMDLLVLR
jgi:ubiquinone/menaquinone biosynthesis C-methylase UbiE